MRIVLQRVKHVELVADGQPFDQMGQGILAMVGIESGDDSPNVMKYMLDKAGAIRHSPLHLPRSNHKTGLFFHRKAFLQTNSMCF